MKHRHPTDDQVAKVTADYTMAYNAAKAAFRAWDSCQTNDLFQVAIEAAEAFSIARLRLLHTLAATPGAQPPDPHLTTTGVSQTHCIK